MITSKENKQFRYFLSLKDKKTILKENLYLIEGDNLIEEAKKTNLLVGIINDSENADYCFDKNLLSRLSSLKNANLNMGVVKVRETENITSSTVLILDDIQDPSNLGTILRSSLAFGIKDIILSPNTVNIYHPKCIRASQGAIFYLNIQYTNLLSIIEELKDNGYKILSTSLKSHNLDSLTYPKKAIIIGNEGRGVSEELLNISDDYIKIPINTIESLNVAIATSIILYENNKIGV